MIHNRGGSRPPSLLNSLKERSYMKTLLGSLTLVALFICACGEPIVKNLRTKNTADLSGEWASPCQSADDGSQRFFYYVTETEFTTTHKTYGAQDCSGEELTSTSGFSEYVTETKDAVNTITFTRGWINLVNITDPIDMEYVVDGSRVSFTGDESFTMARVEYSDDQVSD